MGCWNDVIAGKYKEQAGDREEAKNDEQREVGPSQVEIGYRSRKLPKDLSTYTKKV